MRSSELFENVTSRIIDGLQNGCIPWQNPVRENFPVLPSNLFTRKEYTGINSLLLSLNEFSNPFYGTFNQIQSAGGKVKPGEKSTEIVFWNISVTNKQTKEKIDNDTYLQLPKEQKSLYEVRPFGRLYSVYNLDQIEGISAPKPVRALSLNQKLEACEEIVVGFRDKPEIKYCPGIAAYLPSLDLIRMPELNAFKDSEAHYSVLFHELIHASGHKNRLDRPGVTQPIQFGSAEYSLEELVAEIGSAFLCSKCQIENKTFDNSLGYINAWITQLANDHSMIFKASSQAQRAYSYILGVTL